MDTPVKVKRTGIWLMIDPELRRKFQQKLLERNEGKMGPIIRKWIESYVAKGQP